MENIGALAILLACCLAIYGVIGFVTGKLGRNPFLIVSGERAVYGVWFLITLASAVLVSALLTRLPVRVCGRGKQSCHADDLQNHGVVGSASRFPTAVELAAVDVRRGGRLHQPAQAPGLHALRGGRAFDGAHYF